MAVSDEKVDIWMEEYGRTGSRIAACARIGVSLMWYQRRCKASEDFQRRMNEAEAVLPAQVLSGVIDGLLNGFKYEVLRADGEIVTLRKHSDRMTLAFLERHCGWKDDPEVAASSVKKVSLIGADGQDLDLLSVLARGVAERDGIEIEPARVVEAEEPEDA